MNGAADGPLCSLISYVVPPGLSRVPIVRTTETRSQTNQVVETVSVKSSRNQEAVPPATCSSQTVPPIQKHQDHPANHLSTTSVRVIGKPSSALTSDKSLHSTQQKFFHPSPSKTQTHLPKSCLNKNTIANVVPARLNLRKKTVAFGKTVNVSQTIEGTSHTAKLRHQTRKTTTMQPRPNDNENKENKPTEAVEPAVDQESVLDLLKDVKSSLEMLKVRDEERAEELRSIRRMVDDKGKEMDKLRGILADFFSKDCLKTEDSVSYTLSERRQDGQRKFHTREHDRGADFSMLQSPSPRRRSPLRRDAANTTRQEPDLSAVDDITLEEFRHLMATNAALRQFVADIREEEKERTTGYTYNRRRPDKAESQWRNAQERETIRGIREQQRYNEDSKTIGSRGAKFTEKVTVERSIRCAPTDVGQYSMDTRQFIADQILEDENQETQSMYRPGESVSYYPENMRRRKYNIQEVDDSDGEQNRTRRNYRDYDIIEERRRQRRDRRANRYQDY